MPRLTGTTDWLIFKALCKPQNTNPMIVQLTRTNGDPVFVNLANVLFFYALSNGQTYLIFNCERFNLTIEEPVDVVLRKLDVLGLAEVSDGPKVMAKTKAIA
jgi:hypothetical protein